MWAVEHDLAVLEGSMRSVIVAGFLVVVVILSTAVALAEEITVILPGDVALTLVRIPAGTFMMGSPADERGRYSDEDLHQVTLTQDYYLGKYEVTQRQWQAVMGSNPSYFSSCGLDCPVEEVSWNDICGGATGSSCTATSFIGRLNAHLGTTAFRLPTEAEWERAARAGTQTEFSFPAPAGWDVECGSFPEAEPYMWWCNNSGSTSHPVGTKQPNAYGLYDMHGNVWEGVGDWYQEHLGTSPVTDPTGPSSGSRRVSRGGAWDYRGRFCRSATRTYNGVPVGWGSTNGFRLARSVDGGAPPVANFTWSPTTPTVGQQVQFTDTSTGSPTSWSWAFGDGATSTQRNPIHTYSSAGTYTVTLTATNASGSDTETRQITVSGGTTTGPGIYVPGAAHQGGAAGTNWRTDLEVYNPGSAQLSFTVELLYRDQGNPNPASVPFNLAPGRSVRYGDVMTSVFGSSGAATLRVTPSHDQVLVSSRTYNDTGSGTYGQYIAGLWDSQATRQGQTARLIQLTRTNAYRTNLGVVNVTASTLSVEVQLYSSSGIVVGTRSYSVPPYGSIQRTDVYGEVTSGDVADGYALVRTTTSGGAFLAYASVVDNRTGDPVYVPGR